MKTTFFAAVLSAGFSMIPGFCFGQSPVSATASSEPLAALAQQAVSTDQALAAGAVERLRAAGPDGLDAMFQIHHEAIQTRRTGFPDKAVSASEAEWTRLHDAIDAIGQQRDCYASQLYWFTDFEQAKAAARASGKPILSLRLLGKLNEEYSCANSRFFRTTLYANVEVGRVLREQFILHWQSVRPVPRITIDFGEGRKLERTITGNSIHYVLDSEGRTVDALPGLYGPTAFLTGLEKARGAAIRVAQLSGPARESFLSEYHSAGLKNIRLQWEQDRARLGFVIPAVAQVDRAPAKNPDAGAAAIRATSKMAVEAPLLRGVRSDTFGLRLLEGASGESDWKEIARLHSDEARLDADSYRLMQAKQPATAEEAGRISLSKSFVETPMVRMVRNLERSIAEDTVRNEYLLHSRIHEWLAKGGAGLPLNELNKKVYAELFLTPDSDPWLGLAPADTFSALDQGGLSQVTVKP